MEQIINKKELKEIIAKEVRGYKMAETNQFRFNFQQVESANDFDEINKNFAIQERLRGADNLGLGHPLSFEEYQHGIGCYENYKSIR